MENICDFPTIFIIFWWKPNKTAIIYLLEIKKLVKNFGKIGKRIRFKPSFYKVHEKFKTFRIMFCLEFYLFIIKGENDWKGREKDYGLGLPNKKGSFIRFPGVYTINSSIFMGIFVYTQSESSCL